MPGSIPGRTPCLAHYGPGGSGKGFAMYAVRYGAGGFMVWGCFPTAAEAIQHATWLAKRGHTASVHSPAGEAFATYYPEGFAPAVVRGGFGSTGRGLN